MTQELDRFVAALPFPVLVIGAGDRIELANPSALSLLPTALPGGHYVTALRQPAVLDMVEQVQRGDRATGQAGYLGARDTVWQVTAGAAGNRTVLTFEDRTAQQDADRMRQDFVANVSHELRTPLTAIMGFIDTLQGAARDDAVAQTRFLSLMRDEAQRMFRLVEDLLSLRRVEETERIRPTDPVDLCALVDSVAQGQGPAAAKAGTTITVDRPSVPVIARGDAGQLRQVLNNLVENALKYGATGPVTIRLSEPADEPALQGVGVRLSVSDQGEGIAAHHIARLTERFYRVDTHRSRAVGGTGLGLAIVKHIVNRHRGRLRIDSEPGRGSVFTVILQV